MARGEREAFALRQLRRNLQIKNISIGNKKEKRDHSPIEASLSHTDFYGMTVEEIEEFKSIVDSLEPNINASLFPDFEGNNGILEHFQISSSNENENGAPQIISNRKQDKTAKEAFKQLLETDGDGIIEFVCENEIHSHKWLFQSIKKNVEKHIKSFRNYGKHDRPAIFLLDYDETTLFCFNSRGEKEWYPFYLLSKDAGALTLISDLCSDVMYIAFLNIRFLEVFKTTEMSNLARAIEDEYTFEDANLTVHHVVQKIIAQSKVE